jgi:hypothetical protein
VLVGVALLHDAHAVVRAAAEALLEAVGGRDDAASLRRVARVLACTPSHPAGQDDPEMAPPAPPPLRGVERARARAAHVENGGHTAHAQQHAEQHAEQHAAQHGDAAAAATPAALAHGSSMRAIVANRAVPVAGVEGPPPSPPP